MARYGPHNFERKLGTRKYQFEAEVSAIVAATEERMTALMRESLQDVIEDAQKAKAKGGRMPVDTGFLRASGQPSLNGTPSGPSRGDPKGSYRYDEGAKVQLTLAKLTFGATFFFGWTAEYARIREAYDGFLEGAVMKWPAIVARNCEKLAKRIKP